MSNPIDVPSPSAPPVAKSRVQQRAIATRAKVLVEAAAVFDASGFAAASISDVISSSNLTKGALFHHFSSKSDIAQHLVRHWLGAVTTAFSATATTAKPPAQLREVFLDLARLVESDQRLRAGMKLTLEPAVEGAHQAYRQWVDATSDVVEEAIAGGSISDTPQGHHLAWNLCAGFAGAIFAVPVLREDVDLPARIDDLLTAHMSLVVEQ